jgi:large subunit ribosomal protein L1
MEKKKKPGKAVSDKLKERSREISERLSKMEIKGLRELEKDIKKAAIKQEVEAFTQGKAEKTPKKPAKKPKETSGREKPKVKDIEKVEKELEREAERQKQAAEAGKVYPFSEGIKKARELARKRKFRQTWDLGISLKGIDLKKPENRFSLEFPLPAGRGKPVRVGVIADSLASDAKKEGADVVIRKEEISSLGGSRKRLKKIANSVEWFFGEAPLMPQIGKSFGPVLGPRGKVPKPVPPKADIGVIIKKARKSVRISLKDSPVIHVPVGSEDMKDEDVLKNIVGVYNFVKDRLPKGISNIRSVHLKLTMGKPVRLEVK